MCAGGTAKESLSVYREGRAFKWLYAYGCTSENMHAQQRSEMPINQQLHEASEPTYLTQE